MKKKFEPEMATIDVKRKVTKKGDKVVIQSRVHEVMAPDKFKSIYTEKRKNLAAIEHAMSMKKMEKQMLDKLESTPELEEFVEMLRKAEQLKRKKDIKQELKEIEVTKKRVEDELEEFQQTYDEIKKE